jgi:hypothetical protein
LAHGHRLAILLSGRYSIAILSLLPFRDKARNRS